VCRRLINTPAHSVNIWATYSRRKLNIGLGPRFVGARYGNTTNTRRVGSYATLDAMVGYAVHRRVDLRFNLFNLNNAYYFDRLGGGHLIPGAGRSAMIGTNFRF
jgi:catecholate siderophore receptor